MKAKKQFLKVGAVSPRIRLGDVAHNVKACINEANRAAEMGVKLLVFPDYTLTGATCGDVFGYELLGERAERGLIDFIAETHDLDMVSVISLPGKRSGVFRAVTYRGELLGILPSAYHPGDFDDYSKNGKTITVSYAKQRTELILDGKFAMPGNKSCIVSILGECAEATNIVVYPDATETIIGSRKEELDRVRELSLLDGCAFVVANAGIGESTTDAVYSAHNMIADRGEILAEAEPFALDNLITADVLVAKPVLGDLEDDDEEIERTPRRDYFLPRDKDEQKIACLEALEIQAQGLAARIERSYSKTMVIGVSGGLDSTLALLVCARAADILGMPRTNIVGVTSPCFGTTKRTKSNAEKLCEALGTTLRVVDIKASVTQHLKDIGHDGVTPDVTYENAQARERTQVIMDISNMTGGLVVGTGDLSELALGWATYNGDHMSMYSVNGSVPKTMVRRITEVYSDEHRGEGEVSDILDDILATPVSPELLPPKDDEIAQCTEALVGPYELHDYFLYHMLYKHCGPRRIYENAKYDFEGAYDNETILGWLRVFVRRFFSQQFKRSCLPDGPKVSCISVSPRCGLHMPSDISAAVWLEELDMIEKEEK